MSERYEQHLAALHAKQTIATELLHEILHEVSPARVLSTQRITAGEVNEVYAVTFADGLHVIVRISRDDTKNGAHFAQEQWAIRECGARGVPVPEVLGVWRRATDGHPLDICVQRKIDGVLLRDAAAAAGAAADRRAGGCVTRPHPHDSRHGVGYLNGQGEGAFITSDSEITALLAMEAEFHALAKRVDLEEEAMRRALRVVVEDARAADVGAPCLTHNDFAANHIVVAKDAIAGIIDFGEVAGSEPLSDFVRWDYYETARFPLAWLQHGYANKRVFEADFTRRLHVKRIAFSLWVMRWYDVNGYAEGVAEMPAQSSSVISPHSRDRRWWTGCGVEDSRLCPEFTCAASTRFAAKRRSLGRCSILPAKLRAALQPMASSPGVPVSARWRPRAGAACSRCSVVLAGVELACRRHMTSAVSCSRACRARSGPSGERSSDGTANHA